MVGGRLWFHGGVDPYSSRLISAVDRLVDDWLDSSARARLGHDGRAGGESGRTRDVAAVAEACRLAAATVRRDLAELLETDVLLQRRNPLEILRSSTRPVTFALTAAGVPPVERDEFQKRSFPDDHYDLCPATWSDVHPDLAEVGLEWGAWKAAAVLSRRRDQNEPRSDS